MGEVKVKIGKPQPTEFAQDDVVIDNTTGDIYFKDNGGRLKNIKNSFENVTPDPAPNEIIGDLTVTGSVSSTDTGSFAYIESSGDISASGTIYANNFTSVGGDVKGINFNDDFKLLGNLTASGNISASGKLYGEHLLSSDDIVALGDISASGKMTTSNLVATNATASSATGSFTGSFSGTLTSTGIAALLAESASTKLQTASLLAHTASINTFTSSFTGTTFASLLAHTASINTFTASGFQSPLSMSVGTTLSNTTNIAGTPLYVHGNISSSGDLSVFGEVVHLEGTDPRLKLKAVGANHPGVEWHEDSTRKWVVYNDPDENDNLTFKNDSTELIKISQSGDLSVHRNISASAASTSSFGRIIVEDGMYHTGNENTFINFPTGDKIDVKAGGINFIRVWQKDSDDDKIYFNWNEEEMDVIFRTKQNNPGLVISGSGQVGIGGESNPTEALVVMGNISASGELIGTINGGSF